MKPIIVDMKDMSDSVEVYESRPNSVLIYFIYVLVAMLLVAILWMRFSNIELVVDGNGVFRSDSPVYDVSSAVTGTLVKCNVKDGQYVPEGDILYTLKVQSLDETIAYYKAELNNINERLDILNAYHNSLDNDEVELEAYSDNKYYDEIINKRDLLYANIDSNTNSDKNSNSKDEDESIVKKIYILTEKGNVANEIITCETKKVEYEKYLKDYSIQENNKCIKANASGYFYSMQELANGKYVQEGSHIGKIYPEQQSNYYAEIYVENGDIAKLREGQEVKFEIVAYPSNEYGYFTGKITNISKDITIDQTTGGAYYTVLVSCDSGSETGKAGEQVILMNGMACQAKIVVEEKSVLAYILEKIDLMGD